MADEKICRNCNRKYASEKDFMRGTSRWRVCSEGNLWFNCDCHSTLMIPKGKFPWYSPDKVMSSDAKQLFNLIGGVKNLPNIPAIVMKLQEYVMQPEWSVEGFAAIIKREPGLASELLAMAQRLKASRNPGDRPIESIAHAVSYVGRTAVVELVQLAALRNMKVKTKIFDSERFWKHSLLTGSIAEFLGGRFKLPYLKDELFLAGSLCNVGKVVGAIAVPEQIDKVAEQIKSPKTEAPWQILELKLDAYEHAILGEVGSAFWGFPEFVMDACRNHHEWSSDADRGDVLNFAEVIGLAVQIAHWLDLEPQRMDKVYIKEVRQHLKVSESAFEKIVEECGQVVLV